MSDLARAKIILVDDDPSYLTRMYSFLADDYKCYKASTGTEGLLLHKQLLKDNPLVVCDVNLPDISGFEVCKKIKAVNSQTNVLLLTAYNDSDSRMRGLRAYADQYIDKLISDEELKLLIRNTCLTMSERDSSGKSIGLSNDRKISASKTHSFESKIRSLILAHYKSLQPHRTVWECSSKSVAEKMNMTYRTFQREIKNKTGHSFKKFHLQVRLEKSRALLDSGYSVSQIAELLSFSNPAHLSRSFKEQFGITPSNYKQK